MTMLPIVIADTSALISTASISDTNHAHALTISDYIEKSQSSIIIPADVFSETINSMGKKISHESAAATANFILENKGFLLQDTSSEVRKNALEKFQTVKPLVSYTDCVVMAFADYYDTREIFAFDSDFKDCGYIRIGIDKKI